MIDGCICIVRALLQVERTDCGVKTPILITPRPWHQIGHRACQPMMARGGPRGTTVAHANDGDQCEATVTVAGRHHRLQGVLAHV